MAKRTMVGDLDPKTRDWMQQASDEYLRRHGRFRDLVLRMLAPEDEALVEANDVFETRVVRTRRRTEPTRADLIAAYDESSDPLPASIVAYMVKHYLKALPLKTGPKEPARSTWEKVMINAFYQHQLHKARQRQQAGLTSAPATRAKAVTAKKFGISTGTLSSIIKPLPLPKSPPK